MTERTIDTRLGWLAGIIDGEGWVGFKADAHTNRNGKVYKSADWFIAVGNTNAAMLAEIAAICDILGVKVSVTRYYHDLRRPGYKRIARATVHRKEDCRTLLLAVLPHLIAKRPQAELMLRALNHRAVSGRGRRLPGYIPVEQDAAFKSMADECTRMNRRGTAPVED